MMGRHFRVPGIILLLLVLLLSTAAPARPLHPPDSVITVRPRFEGSLPSTRTIYPHRLLKRPKVGLVLTGGGARGAAQVGVLEALERHGIPIDFITSTSMGAIVGGLYAAGYTAAELKNLALTTNWDEVLSLGDGTKRTELFVEQKIAGDRNFLAVRFQGFEPVFPSAISSGQRLTDFLSSQTLQSLYHAYPDFDHLRIPFRAMATDLISGRRVVLKDGSLAEALRASATVPLLFNPVDKDRMQLVDGGLVDNIPVDVARDAGCDLVIVVNTTSGLRGADEMKAPWQTADQIMGIMMQTMNSLQLARADIVVTPDIGEHLSSDFTGLDTLIAQGETAAESAIPEIERLYRQKAGMIPAPPDTIPAPVNITGGEASQAVQDSVWETEQDSASFVQGSLVSIRDRVEGLYETGEYRDVSASISRQQGNVRVQYTVVSNPMLDSVAIEGCRFVPADTLQAVFAHLIGKPINIDSGRVALESLLRVYRARGYSLARVESIGLDERTGILRIVVNEGVIREIEVRGSVRTEDSFVLREFPLQEGDVFQIEKAKRGLTNISSTTLFEYVFLEVAYDGGEPHLTIRLRERPSQLLRIGLRADNERNLQGSLDIRDENFQGTGTELGMTVDGGTRNADAVVEYRAHRLFDTYLTFRLSGFYRFSNSYLYTDAPFSGLNRWDRLRIGEYRDSRYGAGLSFGSQLERLGNATIEFLLQDVRLRSISNAQGVEEHHRLSMIRAGTVVDTKNSYPFPTSGVGLNLLYEFAIQEIGSDVGYNALSIMYESFSTVADRLTFHPRLTLGVADNTMPLSQQYRFGGLDSFFGLREDDRRGRQLLLMNLEYRYRLPIQFLFETYFMVRYDLGTISALPEDIKLSALQHGIGAVLAFATPVGPAEFGLGKSFYLSRNLPNNPVQQGPLLFYFMIGYQL